MNRLNSARLERPNALLGCVDPSKPGNNTGVAGFAGSSLAGCALWTQTRAGSFDPVPDVCLIELPQVYPGARAEDPNDLIQVARAVGQWEQGLPYGCELHHRTPREWKGQVPKKMHNKRALDALTPSERAILDAMGLSAAQIHNVIDAIAMGLWVYGRIP